MAPLTPRVEYSPHKRTRIVTSYNSGVSVKAISIKEGVPSPSIYGIIKRYRVQKSAKSSPRVGRPPSISIRDKRRIFQLIRDDPFISNLQLIERATLGCSVRTLSRFLKDEGIQHTEALRRPKLTPEIAQSRLEFARQYLRESPAFWRRWIFSDETTIARGEGERQKWVFCRRVRLKDLVFKVPTDIG